MIRVELERLDPGSRQTLETVWRVLPEARLVGGVVRDLIARVAVSDLDLGVPCPPETVMSRLGDAAIRCLPTGLAHGTVTALVGEHGIEITSLRRDERTDGRHATVAWTEDWREDALRRDFTINAMSLDRAGALFDYFDGRRDLMAGRIRFVGDANQRIAEDGLRILRFFRFNARYGGEEHDAASAQAIAASVPRLDRLSAERVWSELRRILLGPRLAATLELMRDLGVLGRLFPGGVNEALPPLVPADPILRLAALIRGEASIVSRRLRLSNTEAERLRALLAPPRPRPGLDDASVRRLLAEFPADLLCGRTWIDQAGSDLQASSWHALRHRLETTPPPVFPLLGRDVLASGIGPGPQIGQLLGATRAWWMAGGCLAGKAECADHLRALLQTGHDARS